MAEPASGTDVSHGFLPDALRVKIRDEGPARNKAVYVALGVTPEGTKDILGLWIETSEGAKWALVARHDRTQEPRRRGHSGLPSSMA